MWDRFKEIRVLLDLLEPLDSQVPQVQEPLALTDYRVLLDLLEPQVLLAHKDHKGPLAAQD
jgi:hypothetical protein